MKTIDEAIEQGIKIGDIVIYNGKPYEFIGYDGNYPIGYRLIPVEEKEKEVQDEN